MANTYPDDRGEGGMLIPPVPWAMPRKKLGRRIEKPQEQPRPEATAPRTTPAAPEVTNVHPVHAPTGPHPDGMSVDHQTALAASHPASMSVDRAMAIGTHKGMGDRMAAASSRMKAMRQFLQEPSPYAEHMKKLDKQGSAGRMNRQLTAMHKFMAEREGGRGGVGATRAPGMLHYGEGPPMPEREYHPQTISQPRPAEFAGKSMPSVPEHIAMGNQGMRSREMGPEKHVGLTPERFTGRGAAGRGGGGMKVAFPNSRKGITPQDMDVESMRAAMEHRQKMAEQAPKDESGRNMVQRMAENKGNRMAQHRESLAWDRRPQQALMSWMEGQRPGDVAQAAHPGGGMAPGGMAMAGGGFTPRQMVGLPMMFGGNPADYAAANGHIMQGLGAMRHGDAEIMAVQNARAKEEADAAAAVNAIADVKQRMRVIGGWKAATPEQKTQAAWQIKSAHAPRPRVYGLGGVPGMMTGGYNTPEYIKDLIEIGATPAEIEAAATGMPSVAPPAAPRAPAMPPGAGGNWGWNRDWLIPAPLRPFF